MSQPRAPNMPLFEPSHDAAAGQLMRQMDAHGVAIGSGQDEDQFSFPADEAFWDNFTTQCRLNEWAVREPLYHVSSNHDPVIHSVNQDWMRAFVGGWERQNPHTVVVEGAEGDRQFFASEDFWNRMTPALRAAGAQDAGSAPAGPGEVIVGRKGQERLRCPVGTWERACDDWEREKQCTPAERQRQIDQRRAEGANGPTAPPAPPPPQQQQQAAEPPPVSMWPEGISGSVPLPYLSLLPGQGRGMRKPGEGELPPLDGSEALFAADDNWWRALHTVTRECPMDDVAVCVAESRGLPNGGVKQRSCATSYELMRRFVAAWNREYPCIITIAVRAGGRVQSAAFAGNDTVWQAVCARASGRATQDLMRRIPDGCVLAHCSLDPSPSNMPVALTAREWAAAMRQFANPDGWWDSWSQEADVFPAVQFRRRAGQPQPPPQQQPQPTVRDAGRTLSNATVLGLSPRALSAAPPRQDAARPPHDVGWPSAESWRGRSPPATSPDRQRMWERSEEQISSPQLTAARREHYARSPTSGPAAQPYQPAAAALPAPLPEPPRRRETTPPASPPTPPPAPPVATCPTCSAPRPPAAPPAPRAPPPAATSPSHAIRIGAAGRQLWGPSVQYTQA